jgi:uncharacterized membrane protein
MSKGRLEAFSDGVIAILITIMVLELKIPHGTDWEALRPIVPVGLSYALSFVFLGIYWNNHHHLLHATERINARVMWANLHLLFWLSLTPFVTAWMGENHHAAVPTALYGGVLFLSGLSYWVLQTEIVRAQPSRSTLEEALGTDRKAKLSVLTYAVAVGLAFINPWLSDTLYVLVALAWLVPDRRLEHIVAR